MPWYRGNTHCHSNESDGDSPPETVINHYKDLGYNFLALTDHNIVVDPARFGHLESRDFILIPGEEVTGGFDGKPLHVNALNPSSVVAPQKGGSVAETLRLDIEAIEEVGALSHVNHPNFYYAITASDLRSVPNLKIIEMWSGHPVVNNAGDPAEGRPSVEKIWDEVLSSGRRIWGVAVDDAHDFTQTGSEWANAGRGWIVVRADELTPAAILSSIAAGDFYASTGAHLKELEISDAEIHLEVDQAAGECLLELICDGKVAASCRGLRARFQIPESVTYGRVRVSAPDGRQCWTQPVYRRH